ncbi:condensin-2 complex subunit D3-like isoform X1 [Haliotis rufescens]|uniref:condensin-2 complex subunit D3-like isoform X1 n=1 Tax=Haliotis rufescens TaxID=6454 RepID=UPI00201EEA92|nr:condensin-2 complex subunit D3-like isoform X1 [Haliotis rufescens]
MAEIERTVEVATALPITLVSEDWVKSVWDNDFTEIDALSEDIREEFQSSSYFTTQLEEFKSLLSDWLVQKEVNTGEGFWTVLVENDVSVKAIIAVLGYLIDSGCKLTSNSEQRAAAILSAATYFKLVSVPGSGAFKVYSPELFIKAVDVFKLWNKLGTCKRKRASPSASRSQSSQSSQRSRKGRGAKRGRKTSAENTHFNISEFPDDDEEEGVEEEELTPREVARFHAMMKNLLQDLVALLETFSLKSSESTAHHTIMVLAEISRMEGDLITTQFGSWPRPNHMSPACLAYKGMTAICSPLHGHVVSMTTATFKYLLQNVLMLIGNNKSVIAQNIPRPVVNTRDNAVKFIRFLIKEGDERVISPTTHLLQHLCTKVPDKTEYRTKVAQTVVSLFEDLPDEAYVKMMEWMKRLSKHQKINNRVMSLDVVALLLAAPQRQLKDEVPAEQSLYTTHRFLVILLISRCSDIAPTVRTRAISAFAHLLSSGDGSLLSTLREMVTPKVGPRLGGPVRLIPTPGVDTRTVAHTEGTAMDQNDQTVEAEGSTAEKTADGVTVDSQAKTPFNQIELTPGFNANLIDDDGVISMLRRRSQDQKVNVRKAALQALECMIRFEAPDYRKEDLAILEERCADPSLSVRKQAMMSLTELLLQHTTDTKMQRAWLDGVLPLVMDRETTLQDKCIETLEDIVLDNVVPHNRSKDEGHQLVWSLLSIMTQYESLDLKRYLQRACQHWSRQGKLKGAIVNHLQTHLDTQNDKGAWLLLAEIATSFPKMNNDFLLKYWDKHSAEMSNENSTWPQVISVIGCVAKHLPADRRTDIADELKDRLKKFDSSPQLTAVIINTLSKLCEAGSDESTSRRVRESWCSCLLNACDEYLSHIILNEEASSIGSEEEDQIVRYLFTLGEIAQLCPAKTPKRVFMLVQSLIAAPCIDDESGSQEIPCSQTFPSSGEVTSSQGTVLSQPLSQFRDSKMSGKIRAHAFITLGKLCLQNENLAKKCIAALARELETSHDPNIRNNVIIIMCDLCVRYTTLVDRYVANIASCLKDPSPLVRKQTLTLMTRLLQEDFLKWKGVLFYRFITTLLDTNTHIRDFAEFCLIHLLLQRQPTMFFHHFVECIFHFNAYQAHSVYNKFTQSDREKQMFSLSGKQNADKRLKLYLFMLEHMTDEHRFQLSAKICQDILGSAVDGVLPLEGESTAILQDALAILGSKEIKLSSLKVRPHDDVAEEQDMAAVVMATAKKTLITQVLKKNVIENIVPIVTSLKKMLEKQKSPVLRYLMLYLRELMKDYKNEVKDILSADKQLATEIEYDLRMFEEQQAAAEKRRHENTPVQRAPIQGRLSMSPASGSPRPDGSPKPGSPARSPSTPKQGKSPAPGSAKPPTPVGTPGAKPQSPLATNKPSTPLSASRTPERQGTPSRCTPLATLAILNSARKALTRNTVLREVRNSPKPKEKAKATEREKERRRSAVKWADKDGGALQEVSPSQAENNTENVRTPPRRTRKSSRAISTPSAHLAQTDVLGNITFAGEQNITLIPPSPIPTSVPVRVYPDVSEDATSASPVRQGRNKPRDDLVYMFSPDKPAPRVKPWNIKPSSTAAVVESGDAEPAVDGEEDEAAEVSVSTRSRRQKAVSTATRRSSRSKR